MLQVSQETNDFHNNQSFADRKRVNYVFGTDMEPFVFEIAEDLETKIMAVPWDLRLKNHQACVRLSENKVFFCGGVNYYFNKVYDLAFTFNLETQKIKRLPRMHQIRFFSSALLKDDYVYVIGGRSYGNDHQSILACCERFSLASNK